MDNMSQTRLGFQSSRPHQESSPATTSKTSVISPITNLAFNLSETSLNSAHRRLSFSSNSPTPKPNLLGRKFSADLGCSSPSSDEASPMMENRFFRASLRASRQNSTFTSPRHFVTTRRIQSLPLSYMQDSEGSFLENKENVDNRAGEIQASKIISPQPFKKNQCDSVLISPGKPRLPLEDFDYNSQDSGYSASQSSNQDKDDGRSHFRFVEPSVPPSPRQPLGRLLPSPSRETSGSGAAMMSPTMQSSPLRNKSPKRFRGLGPLAVANTFSSNGDDGFSDAFELESMNENAVYPTGLSRLLSAPITPNFSGSEALEEDAVAAKESKMELSLPKPSFRRCLSMVDTPTSALTRTQKWMTEAKDTPKSSLNFQHQTFKRPDPPSRELVNPVQSKRPRKASSFHYGGDGGVKAEGEGEAQRQLSKLYQRHHSENEATIKRALQRSCQDPDLIGDFSRAFSLPRTVGRHQDLQSISGSVLAQLMRGELTHLVRSFSVVDCRYPYEFQGGHIKGALNVYCKDQVLKEFLSNKKDQKEEEEEEDKGHVLIFHCEFSSERGPNLLRFLRNHDRDANKESYPRLYYPEIYLLDGGYKAFFEMYNKLCVPSSYVTMLDPSHEADLRHFRAKSKSWSGDGSGLAGGVGGGGQAGIVGGKYVTRTKRLGL